MLYKIQQRAPGKGKPWLQWTGKACGMTSRAEAERLKKLFEQLHPELQFRIRPYGTK